MTSISDISFAPHVHEAWVASSRSGATSVVTSGTPVYVKGFEISNPHTVAVSVSGVPIWENPDHPNHPRFGVIVPASGTVISNVPFQTLDGLVLYSTSAGGTSAHARLFTD